MNFFGGSQVAEITKTIKLICDESIPGEEIDLNKSFELIDDLKSRKFKPEDFQSSWVETFSEVETLNESNPTSYNRKIWERKLLFLLKLCVKNCGISFIAKLFYVNNENKDRYLLNPVLRTLYNRLKSKNAPPSFNSDVFLNLIQSWYNVFSSQLIALKNDPLQNSTFSVIKDILSPIASLRQDLLDSKIGLDLTILQQNQLSNFDDDPTDFSETFLKTEAPPEWLESGTCMICNTSFGTLNRQHHCRKCGGAFCGQHSNNFRFLPLLGFNEPVRVCDTCVTELDHKKSGNDNGDKKSKLELLDHKQMELALANSLKDFQLGSNNTNVSLKNEYESNTYATPARTINNLVNRNAQESEHYEEDDDLKRAIELSLKEAELEKQRKTMTEETYKPVDTNSEIDANGITKDVHTVKPSLLNNSSQQNNDSNLLNHELQSRITGKEVESIQLFSQLMTNLTHQRQQGDVSSAALINNPELQRLFMDIIKLKSKLNKNINEDFNSYDALIDFQSKLSTVTRLYDDLLQKRLSLRNTNRYSMMGNIQQEQQVQLQITANPVYQQNYLQSIQPNYTSNGLPLSSLPAFNPTYERPSNISAAIPQSTSMLTSQYTGLAPKYSGISPQFTGVAPQYAGVTHQYTGVTHQYTGSSVANQSSVVQVQQQAIASLTPSEPPEVGVVTPQHTVSADIQAEAPIISSMLPQTGISNTTMVVEPAPIVPAMASKPTPTVTAASQSFTSPAASNDPFQNVLFPQVPSTSVLQTATALPETNSTQPKKEDVNEIPMLIEL